MELTVEETLVTLDDRKAARTRAAEWLRYLVVPEKAPTVRRPRVRGVCDARTRQGRYQLVMALGMTDCGAGDSGLRGVLPSTTEPTGPLVMPLSEWAGPAERS